MIPDDDLSQLLNYKALTEAQLSQLASLGITSCAELVAKCRKKTSRAALAARLRVSDDKMVYTTAVARLLLIQGPGEMMIRAELEQADPETLDASAIEGLAKMINSDDKSIVTFLTELEYESTADILRGVARTDVRNVLILFAVLVLVFLAAGVWFVWDYLFPSSETSPATLNAYMQLRSATFITVAATIGWVAVCLGVAVLSSLTLQAVDSRIGVWIANRFLTPLDRTIVASSIGCMPPRLRQARQWFVRRTSTIQLVLMFGGLVVFSRWSGLPSAQAVGYIFAAFVAIAAFVDIYVQVRGFRCMAIEYENSEWVTSAGNRFARAKIIGQFVQFLRQVVLLLLLLYLAGIAVGRFDAWHAAHQEQAAADFAKRLVVIELDDGEQGSDRDEWLAWSQAEKEQAIEDYHQIMRETDVFARTIVRFFALVLLGAMLFSAIGEYLWANRSRGLMAFGVWLATLVGSETIPDRAAAAAGVDPGTVQAVVLAFGVAALIGILGEYLPASKDRPGVKYCSNPNCTVVYCPLYGEDDQVCSRCGEALTGSGHGSTNEAGLVY